MMIGKTQLCPNCNQEIDLAQKVCGFCGAVIVDASKPVDELEIWPRKGEGLPLRFIAVLNDALIIFGLSAFILIGYSNFWGSVQKIPDFFSKQGISSIIASAGLLTFPIVWWVYFTLFESAFCTTPGKALLGLRVLQKDGSRCGFRRAAIRAAIGIFETNPIGMLAILLTPLNQRLGDLAAGTLVVNRRKVHKVTFQPEALIFELQDGRCSEFARVEAARITRFGFMRTMHLRGVTRSGRSNKATLPIQVFPNIQKMDRLQYELERQYAIKFVEKLEWQRLTLVLVILGLIMVLIWLGLYYTKDQWIDFFSRTTSPSSSPIALNSHLPTPSTIVERPSSTPTPTRTPKPTLKPTLAFVEVDFDTINQYEVGHPIIIMGRLALMSNTFCDGKTCAVLLKNPNNPDQSLSIFVKIPPEGATPAPNQMKTLFEGFQKSDILLRTENGVYAAVGYRVRLHGRVCHTTEGNACVSDITRIEIVPAN